MTLIQAAAEPNGASSRSTPSALLLATKDVTPLVCSRTPAFRLLDDGLTVPSRLLPQLAGR